MDQAELGPEFAAAFNRRDLDGMLALVTDDVELVPIRAAVEDTVYRGTEGIVQWMHDLEESWSELRIEFERIEQPAPDRQIVYGRVVGRGVESSAPVEMRVRWLGQLRDGRLARIETVVER